MDGSIIEKAYAKVNLELRITGIREDGYHLLDMDMQTISLHDTLTFKRSDTPGLRLFLRDEPGSESLACEDAHSTAVPKASRASIGKVSFDGGYGYLFGAKKELSLGNDNLITKAAKALAPFLPADYGAEIGLVKRIPMEAGLGGGSADCAAALRGLNRLFSLGLSDEKLEEIGLSLGADVPFMVRGGRQRAKGVGEKLAPLAPLPSGEKLLIIKPAFGVETRWAYREYDNICSEKAKAHQQQDVSETRKPEKQAEHSAQESGLLRNDLEEAVLPSFPRIRELKERLAAEGAVSALMSGSGSAVFGLFRNEKEAEGALENLLKETEGIEALFLVSPV